MLQSSQPLNMTSPFQKQSTLRFKQLLVEQQKREECEEMEEILDDFMVINRDLPNVLKDPHGLKINEERLLKYAAPFSSQTKQCLVTAKLQFEEKLNRTQLLRTKSRQSLKAPQLIKHKVTPRGFRLKTIADKENIEQSFLPELANKNKNKDKQNILNKTTSVLAFRASDDLQSSQAPSTSIGAKANKFNQELQLNSSQRQDNCIIKSSRYLKQTLKKAPSSLRLRQGGNQSHSQVSCQPTSIVTALTQITSKQDELLEEKRQLQQRVKQLKQQIQREQHILEEAKTNQHKLSYQMSRQSYQQRLSLDEVKLSKKKNYDYMQQAKKLELEVGEFLQANTKVLESIEEEKQLIIMYDCVIEELRGQLKLQKQAKHELQKRLAIMKKTMKSLQARVVCQEASNRQLVRKIYSSLQKWR